MHIISNWGFICLAIYLIIIGAEGLFGFTLGGLQIIVPILALIAGILIIIGK